jgi:hypothetical protein
LAGLSMRQSDLMFAGQTRTVLAHAALQVAQPRDDRPPPRVDVVPIAYRGFETETALKGWDYSGPTLAQRWQAGYADMTAALARWRAVGPGDGGVRILSAAS